MISTAQVVEDYLDGELPHMASPDTIYRLLCEHSCCGYDRARYRQIALRAGKVNDLGHLLVWLGY